MQIKESIVTDALVRIKELCLIPSPSGFTHYAVKYLTEQFAGLNIPNTVTNKGSVIADLGGEGQPLVLAAHIDTLGAMVRAIRGNGTLRLTKIGGYPENYIESETCLVHTRDGKKFTGTFLLTDPSVHVNNEVGSTRRSDSNIVVYLDEKVKSADDVKKLGIKVGDFISIDPRTVITETGFIKSRHLDDKASAGILLALAKAIKEDNLTLNRRVYLLFTTYEEVGHGGASGIPEDVVEMISVDMGCIGDDLQADEYMVSICAKDSGGPYDYEVTTKLINLAEKNELQYAVDIYPSYGSDVEATLSAGYDLKHGLIGPGVFASHGYERTHKEGVENTLKLLYAYIISGQ